MEVAEAIMEITITMEEITEAISLMAVTAIIQVEMETIAIMVETEITMEITTETVN